MLVLASHALCLAALSAASVYDLLTTEVPDYLPAAAVGAGLLLHAAQSFAVGSMQPILWSIGAGALFSAYGWGLYFAGMWGGADALAMSTIGFAAPTGLAPSAPLHLADVFVNIMIAGFVYTLGFAAFKAYASGGILQKILERFRTKKTEIGLEAAAAVAVSVLIDQFYGFNGAVYALFLLGMIALYHGLKVLESEAMKAEKPASDVEPGEVVEAESLDGRIKGITEEEIQELGDEQVVVKTGVRFVPVFPAALLMSELSVGGMAILQAAL